MTTASATGSSGASNATGATGAAGECGSSGLRAVFLDRDGVIVPEDDALVLQPFPFAARAIAKINDAGWLVVVVTNQPLVARGARTEAEVQAQNADLLSKLAVSGGVVDAVYYCPHHPEATLPEYRVACVCRKPRPGMLLRAAGDLGISLRSSIIVGDRMTDIEAGHRAGCELTILVKSGSHAAARVVTIDDPLGVAPGETCGDLGEAIDLISDRYGWGSQ